MSIYIRSCDYEMWEVIMDSPYMPKKTKRENGKLEPKLRSEWTDAEMKKVCRCQILSGLLCLFLFWASDPFVARFEFEPRT